MIDRKSSQFAPHFRHYRAYGVSIRSELRLPLPEMRRPVRAPLFELEIRVANKPLAGAIAGGVTRQLDLLPAFDFRQLPNGSSYVRWEGLGEALVSKNGRSIACHPFQQADSESFYVYLLGQVLSFALVSNGLEPLHATAIVIAGQAIAFLGDCGVGKSTLASAFLQAGHRLLTDDLLLLRTTTEGVLAYPGPARIKLFPEVAHTTLGMTAGSVPMNPKTQKLVLPLEDRQACADAVPLAAIYALAPSGEMTGNDICIGSISERRAFIALLGSAFNSAIVDPARLRRQFEATQALAHVTIVRRLSYPRSLECLPLVREAILSDLAAERSELAPCEA